MGERRRARGLAGTNLVALTPAERALVERHVGLVRAIAARLVKRLPRSVDAGELESMGWEGLLRAGRKFQEGRGVRFETFAKPVIRGAMLDGLRKIDPARRPLRNYIKRLEVAAEKLRQRHGCEATPEELAKELGLGADSMLRKEVLRTAATLRSLSGDGGRSGGRVEGAGGVPSGGLSDARSEDPARAAQRRMVKEYLLRGLDRSERLVMVLYYFEQMKMKEIGLVLELSEGRVSQIHAEVLERLRGRMKEADFRREVG